MILLALDASTTATGWAVFSGADPIDWGQFSADKGGLSPDDGAAYINQVCGSIFLKTQAIVNRHGAGVIVYEMSDWHRNVLGGTDRSVRQRKADYAIERRALAALNRVAATMAVFSYMFDIHVVGVGALEVKNYIGNNDKEQVAMWVASNWPDRFEYVRGLKKGHYITDKRTSKPLSNHVSDALSIGGYYIYQSNIGQ